MALTPICRSGKLRVNGELGCFSDQIGLRAYTAPATPTAAALTHDYRCEDPRFNETLDSGGIATGLGNGDCTGLGRVS